MKKPLIIIIILVILQVPSYSQIAIGDPVIPFTLPNLSNQLVSLQQYAGEIILINFFATWCPPCQIEAPQLEDSIWQVYMNQGVTVLGVSIQESAGTVLQFQQQYNLTYPMVLDVTASVFSSYGFSIIPSNVLVDRDGRVVWIEEGFNIPRFVHLVDSLVQLTDIQISDHSHSNPESFELLGAYPNPFNNTTNIRINVRRAGQLQIKVFDAIGRIIISENYRVSTGKNRITLRFNNHPSGAYLYTITMGNERTSSRVILQK